MRRSALGFLLAPLWVPAIVAPLSMFVLFPDAPQWAGVATLIAVGLGYGGTLAIGLPCFLLLRARRVDGFWVAAAVGVIAGGATWAAFVAFFATAFGEGTVGATAALLRLTPAQLLSFILPMGIGALVGASLWVVVRPDRAGP